MRVKRIIKIIFLLIGFFAISSLSYAETPHFVRVAIVQDAPSLRLKIGSPFEVIDAASSQVIYRGNALNTTVTMGKGGILLGTIQSQAKKLLIRTVDSGTIMIDNSVFRGDIHLIRRENQRFLVVNYIELEDYVKGILYHEVSHYWPIEVLKVQAIISRTYAVYQSEQNKAQEFDVTDDTFSQVYGGKTSERYRTSRAVNETRAQVVTYQNKVLPTYFHATCAGATEDANALWNIDLAPLKGVVCNFCKNSPHFNWHAVLSTDELRDKLVSAGYRVQNIKGITSTGRDRSGRITDLRIVCDDKELKIPAKDFRSAIGPNVIRSTNFNVNIVDNDVVFEGIGWGHGVGLCQWGAYFMAKEGFTHEQILNFYYPGATISTLN